MKRFFLYSEPGARQKILLKDGDVYFVVAEERARGLWVKARYPLFPTKKYVQSTSLEKAISVCIEAYENDS